MSVQAQNTWKEFDRLMADGSYKSAYALAEGVYKKSVASDERLAAAYHMTVAAAPYQEDVHDSAKARYRALLPTLAPLEKALCHAFLGEYDSALVHSEVLKQTPVERIKQYCEGTAKHNMTPTAYDVIVREAMEDSFEPKRQLELQQMLVDFHAADSDDGLRILLRRQLLESIGRVPNRDVTLADWQRAIDDFRGSTSPYYTMLYHGAAAICQADADYVQALRYCDTAIALDAKSEGGVACSNMRGDILQRRVSLDADGLTVAPGRASLQRVQSYNTGVVTYRVIPYVDDFQWGDKRKTQLLAARTLASGRWNVERRDDYRPSETYVTLPPLEAGRYLILVAPADDFKSEGFMAYEMHCTDMLLLQQGQEGLLLDRTTGHPIVGQQVSIVRREYNDKPEVRSTRTTDSDGRFRFDISGERWSDLLVIERNGYRLETRYSSRQNIIDTAWRWHCEVRTDRPIYKPGDTVHMALLCYRGDGVEAMVVGGQSLQVRFLDPNGQEVAADSLVSDDFGTAATTFAVPKDRLAGAYSLVVVSQETPLAHYSVRVEEYKQPKFMVSLHAAEGELPQFGTPCVVQGLASSYSAVPVSGARVQYTVKRQQTGFLWWRRYWNVFDGGTEVAAGETTTASDGGFTLSFVPEPDSNVELSTKPVFLYTVTATVTDLNGESHDQTLSLRVGFTNAVLSLADGREELNALQQLVLTYEDLNGSPLSGPVRVAVEQLRQPDVPKLDAPVTLLGANRTQSVEEWRRDFPLYAPDDQYNNKGMWPVARRVVAGEWQVVDGKCTVDLPTLPSGTYRVTLRAAGADSVVHHHVLTLPDESKPQGQQLLWSEVDRTRAEVGQTVRLRLGSRFHGVEVYCHVRVGNTERMFRRIVLDNEIRTIDIPVDRAMLGGFHIDLYTVLEGVERGNSYSIDVPFSHKRLQMEIATFRDKLLPGESEEWTIRVAQGEEGVESAVIMTMYDDALNSYGSADSWTFAPWRHNWSSAISPLHYDIRTGHWLKGFNYLYYTGAQPSWWNLKEALPYYNRWYGRMMYKTAGAKRNPVVSEMVVEEEAALDAAEPAMALNARAVVTDEQEEALTSDEGGSQEMQVRTNLNTLAFFAPALRTDADGMATFRFTVPELLTRWNVRGMAVTRDIKIGTLDRTLVTSKPLMVQPNMPRFLRSGDSLSLLAKVVLNEEYRNNNEELPVEVDLLLTDAATGDTLCHHTERVLLRDAAQVAFDVEVPNNVYVATYRIVAHADGMSDGEQGQVPVVSNRQAVTISQALYINGVGEKRFSLPEWLAGSASRQPFLLAAEVTTNPLWLAVKAMPYLGDLENPSATYLASQLHINTLGRNIMGKLDIKGRFDKLEEIHDSRLRMNEDVKQTLLQATPWVRDAMVEEEQMAAVKNYFDSARLDKQLAEAAKQLAERQNADGGWSWMPEGQSSLWVTQQVLKNVAGTDALARRQVEQALSYVDREQQRYYDRYIKPYLKKGYQWNPTDIDYLYTRSFYGTGTTEAYKFYYSNALKRYPQYTNLYTQAQLALVFQRHGDRKAARDIVRRLKEKSLSSDEMGLYWRDNQSGWFWYSRPIETQALLIQAFAEVAPDDTLAIGQMQQWLLKQKQTTHWGNERATTEAIHALTITGSEPTEGAADGQPSAVQMTVLGAPMTAESQGMEGYRTQRWTGTSLDSVRRLASDDIVVRKQSRGIAWGAVYYQFTDDMDRIPHTEMGIKLKRTYQMPAHPKVGDRVKVRVDIQCDRAMDYLELVDGRPSCVEPLSTRAGWRWNDGLSYYITVGNTDTRCYIEHLDKGKYWFEYEVYLTNPGHFLSGPVTMQCMYAPEFRATAPAQSLDVAP